MPQEITVLEAALGGLLHDIGKLGQRTERSVPDRDNMDVFCPWNSHKNYHSHQHVMYTYEFVSGHRDMFPQDVRPDLLATTAAGHHKPSSAGQKIMELADKASAGTDRMKTDETPEGKYYEISLRSVFDSLQGSAGGDPSTNVYGLGPLEPSYWMPVQASPKLLTRSDYTQLETMMESDLKVLEGLPTPRFLTALDAVMERYLWCIPSSTKDGQDVSLYDHNRTTGAFAAAIVAYLDHNGFDHDDVTDRQWTSEHKPFLFVNGDLSGIQKYIFDLRSNTRSAKILRARSYELQMLTDSVSGELMRRVGVPLWNRVYSSAGRFLLVLPNTDRTRDILTSQRRDVEEFILKEYVGQLALNLDEGLPVGVSDLQQANMKGFFARLRFNVQEAKHRKLQAGLARTGAVLSSVADPDLGVCVSCGMRPASRPLERDPEDGTGDGDRGALCRHCDGLERMGRRLPKAERIAFVAGEEKATYLPRIVFDPEDGTGPVIHQVNQFVSGHGLIRSSFHMPTDGHGNSLDFATIARTARGASHLAMLKADVDRLGWIFSNGLDKSLSISRYVTLSRMMDLFFTGHLHHILTEDKHFSHVYTVYSGGDDLCLIGPWDAIIDLAIRINQDFHRYVGAGNPVTLSTGISLQKAAVPVKAMADRAESALKQSKEERNRVTAFGSTCTWGEFAIGVETGNRFVRMLETDQKLSTGSVYRLLDFYKNRKRVVSGGTRIPAEALVWRSALRYHLTRNWPEDHRQEVVELFENHPAAVPVAVNYAMYAKRTNGGEVHEYQKPHSA